MFYIGFFYFQNERFAHFLIFGEQIAQVAHQKWANERIARFFERIAHSLIFSQKKSNLLRKLMSEFPALPPTPPPVFLINSRSLTHGPLLLLSPSFINAVGLRIQNTAPPPYPSFIHAVWLRIHHTAPPPYPSFIHAVWLRIHHTASSWPCSWFLRLMGKYEAMEMVR